MGTTKKKQELINSGTFPSSKLVNGVGYLALVVQGQRLELFTTPAVVEPVYDLFALLVANVVEARE